MAWQQWGSKQDRSCTYCGAADQTLDYHHRQPSKKLFALGGHPGLQWNADEIAAEMSKCDLSCHSCHVRVHRAANAAFYQDAGENLLRSLRDGGLKPIHVDAALTLLRDMKAHPDVADRLLRRRD